MLWTPSENRVSAVRRGYDARWRQASNEFKRSHPFCIGCLALGHRRPTEVVDHVVPHRGNQTIFWNVAKWQASCRWHHERIKKRLEAQFEAGQISEADLWLNSSHALALARRLPLPQVTGTDGWGEGGFATEGSRLSNRP